MWRTSVLGLLIILTATPQLTATGGRSPFVKGLHVGLVTYTLFPCLTFEDLFMLLKGYV